MSNKGIKGYVHSIQSMGTIDGPGVRFVVFLQGCNLRCGCCHNPDTWKMNEGQQYLPLEIVRRAVRCREYFGTEGGITLSGGEPLLQADFAGEIFRACHEEEIHTCLDTSGSVWNESVSRLLDHTDRVLLDIKYTDESFYRRYVGCNLDTPMRFLECLNERRIATTLRQVIIPTLNDTAEGVATLRAIAERYPCVDKVELLPFRKICQVKYDELGIPFAFSDKPTPTKETMDALRATLGRYAE